MIAPANNLRDAGIRKAAILVASLDRTRPIGCSHNWARSALLWSGRP